LRNVLQSYITLDHLEFLFPTAESHAAPAAAGIDLREAVQQLEKSLIKRALRQANGNRTQAAKLLGISRRALFRKLADSA
jgi:transcriptional regulator with PAS, ATPase and Fis domain